MAPRNLLVRAPNPVGDLVMATASLDALRRAFPEARITVLLRPGREKVLAGLDSCDETLADESAGRPGRLLEVARELRARRFDTCLLLANSFRTALLAFLARIPVRIGYRKGGRGVLLTHPVEPEREGRKWRPRPMPEVYGRLCAVLGVEAAGLRPRLDVSASCEGRARAARRALGIAPGERLAGLAPGASFGASKLWAPEAFARLGDEVARRYGLRSIIFSAPGEETIARAIEEAMETEPVSTVREPLDLDLLKPFIRDLVFMVSTDSGLRHYAAALGVPVVVLVGPTDPRWSAHSLELTEVVRHEVECGPCHLHVCPLDHRCMRRITPEEVLGALRRLEGRFVRS